jgi:hypothetical protein
MEVNEGVNMHCPLCGLQVLKVVETDKDYKTEAECGNEYYSHRGDKLIKFKHPKHDYFEKDALRK